MATSTSRLTRPLERPADHRLTVLLDNGTLGVNGRPASRRDRLIARVRAFSLDALLSAGRAPETDRYLAIRAQVLVDPSTRRRLARDWGHLVDVIQDSPKPSASRVPICRHSVLETAPAIQEMVALLSVPLPVPVRGVAIASHLLSDGSGPLYYKRCPLNLGAAVQSAISYLDPSLEFQA
jgi:hypothetical protein